MATLKDLIEHDLLSPGEQLESTSRKWPAKAALTADGSVLYEDASYGTPSGAARAVRMGKETNGWSFWHVRRPAR